MKKQDVDLDTGEIRILNTIMQKSRIVVMSDDMLSLTRKYMTLRNMMRPESDYLFPSPDGTAYAADLLQRLFIRSFALANPHISQELLPPVRVYDLRRRFATAVLNCRIDEKQDVNSRLPYLRTYMGHRDIAATAYYIHLLPEQLVKSAGIDWERMGEIIIPSFPLLKLAVERTQYVGFFVLYRVFCFHTLRYMGSCKKSRYNTFFGITSFVPSSV